MTQQQLAEQIDFLGKQLAFFDRKSLDSSNNRDLQNHRIYREKTMELERRAAQALSAYYSVSYADTLSAISEGNSLVEVSPCSDDCLPLQIAC